MSDFKREERYLVFKRKDLCHMSEKQLKEWMWEWDIETVDCVVVESDWPNYEHTWETIQAVAEGSYSRSENALLCVMLPSSVLKSIEGRDVGFLLSLGLIIYEEKTRTVSPRDLYQQQVIGNVNDNTLKYSFSITRELSNKIRLRAGEYDFNLHFFVEMLIDNALTELKGEV
jgi:hypothetical protein